MADVASIVILVVGIVLMGMITLQARRSNTIDLRDRLEPYDQARYVAARRREKSLTG